MRNVTWQRVSPAPPAPAQENDSLSTEERGSVADDESTLVQGGWGVADELIDDLAHMNDLDLMWGFDLDAFLIERAQQAPAVGEAGGGTLETIGSCQRGAVDVPLVPEGRADRDDWFVSRGRGGRPLGPSRKDR